MSNQESFIREVDEEYRREQTAKFFKTYGVYLIVGAFVVLAVVGGYEYGSRFARPTAREAAMRSPPPSP